MTGGGHDAVVLAGGRSSRMGVPDKTRLVVEGMSLLDRVLAAVTTATTVVAVGEPRPTIRADLRWALEEPPGGGPAAGLAAALPLLGEERVVVLAGDLPFVSPQVVQRLVDDLGTTGVVGVDAAGREQWTLSAWRVSALRTAGLGPGVALRQALGGLRPSRIRLADVAVTDCDTPDDLRRARERA